jgi:hypothetical protein
VTFEPKVQQGTPLGTQSRRSEFSANQCSLTEQKSFKTANPTSCQKSEQETQGSSSSNADLRSGNALHTGGSARQGKMPKNSQTPKKICAE